MATRKRPAAQVSVSSDRDLYAKLACAGGSKTRLVDAMMSLKKAGWLDKSIIEQCTDRTVRQRLSKATDAHCKASTPYGRVVQSMEIGHAKLKQWDFAHPIAYMYYLAVISVAFADLLTSMNECGVPTNLIIYLDEICPGSRTLFALRSLALYRRSTGLYLTGHNGSCSAQRHGRFSVQYDQRLSMICMVG